MTLKSHKVAPYIEKKVSGIIVPDAIVDRLRKSNDSGEEGGQICVEQIERLKAVKWVCKVHIMTVAREYKMPEIVGRAGLGHRPDLR
jgi:methylenetetrahydrofolate reductase (NADPH)